MLANPKKIALLMVAALATTALADTKAASEGNVVSFAVESSQSVANDHAYAVLAKTVQAKDAGVLASQINPIINQALAIAKKYPTVKASTGQPNAYPSYDDKGNITGLTAQARLNLSSQNTSELSALIGELQPLLVLEDMRFEVSEVVSEQTEQRLMRETTKKFQTQAQQIAQAWGAKSYRLLNASLNHDGTPHHRIVAPMAMATKAYDNTPQVLEAGESRLTYRISGSIFLIY